jgi:ATP phosphoribosyltransferase
MEEIFLTIVKFAIPKGHLSRDTFDLLNRAGYEISGHERTYRPSINDPQIELKVLRPQEIPTFVAEGMQDVGISGLDWIKENKADVETLLDLEYSRVRLVLAVPKDEREIDDLSSLLKEFIDSDEVLRISTEYLNAAQDFIKANPVYKEKFGEQSPTIVTPWWRTGENGRVVIYLSFGATEAKPPEDADAIIEVVETGTSLEQNNLKIVETLMETSAILIANKEAMADPEKRVKITDILTLLKGVVDGVKKLHIFANVEKRNLEDLLESLPALKNPTISSLSDPEWVAINTVIDKNVFLQIMPTLRRLAQGLVVYEPRQVLPLAEIASENGV